MYDVKMTNAQLQRSNDKIIRVGYCGCQNLLKGLSRYGYNIGVYGWNWDAYDLGDGVTVCTGYRNLTGDKVEYRDLEEKASKIFDYENCRQHGWEWQQEQLNKLRQEFVQRARA